MYKGFELGPIRPPSEAYSLLLRVVRGCAWNKCKFCAFYRREKFAVRPVEDIKRDIDEIKSWIDVFEGKQSKEIKSEADYESYYMASNWYHHGMESVFFQDGNSILMKPENMIELLEYLKNTFPMIKRITTYARSDAIARIDDKYLKRYAELGLNRFHVGMETGNDELLVLINKGVNKETQIKAGKKAMNAGIEVSEFYMPGLGGKEYAHQSALDTADVLNQINPDFIRIRSMALSEKLDLYVDYENGIFTRTNDIDNIIEIRTLIENLEGIDSVVESDHILNILLELRGKLPEGKAHMLKIIDQFLSLSEENQMIFRLGRRIGVMSHLEELNNDMQVKHVKDVMKKYHINSSNIDDVSNELMIKAIPIQA
jgi:radical SAM superfamily enzyme